MHGCRRQRKPVRADRLRPAYNCGKRKFRQMTQAVKFRSGCKQFFNRGIVIDDGRQNRFAWLVSVHQGLYRFGSIIRQQNPPGHFFTVEYSNLLPRISKIKTECSGHV
jgi:hypothetical protein